MASAAEGSEICEEDEENTAVNGKKVSSITEGSNLIPKRSVNRRFFKPNFNFYVTFIIFIGLPRLFFYC